MSNVDGESDVIPTKPQTTRTDLRKLSSRKLGDPSDIRLIGDGSCQINELRPNTVHTKPLPHRVPVQLPGECEHSL